ncbi:MAG: hypothetical protein EOR16_33585 [Mesorhizobium sp.]|uniref:hypothetical protein n=1 Tax=Mesorhizobium sp. TaxID=1871066 RepID=UPI000FEA478E|nr:hypothetical protein [Mesorhizobium sp.]RWI48080.1 MAG: hypothetical protein EOR16_33585 [Mesorhizobium sp.]
MLPFVKLDDLAIRVYGIGKYSGKSPQDIWLKAGTTWKASFEAAVEEEQIFQFSAYEPSCHIVTSLCTKIRQGL